MQMSRHAVGKTAIIFAIFSDSELQFWTGAKVERVAVSRHLSLPRVLAQRLYEDSSLGMVLVLHDNPFNLHRLARKRWLKLIYRDQLERARTLTAERIADLSQRINHARRLKFSSKPLRWSQGADIVFASSKGVAPFLSYFSTLHVTQPLSQHDLQKLLATMRRGTVILYEQE